MKGRNMLLRHYVVHERQSPTSSRKCKQFIGNSCTIKHVSNRFIEKLVTKASTVQRVTRPKERWSSIMCCITTCCVAVFHWSLTCSTCNGISKSMSCGRQVLSCKFSWYVHFDSQAQCFRSRLTLTALHRMELPWNNFWTRNWNLHFRRQAISNFSNSISGNEHPSRMGKAHKYLVTLHVCMNKMSLFMRNTEV